MRAGGGYDPGVLRPWLGDVVHGGLGRAVDLETEAVVGPGVLLVIELDRALAVDDGLEPGVLAGGDNAALCRVRTSVVRIMGVGPDRRPVGRAGALNWL